jgi:hypothetical protein
MIDALDELRASGYLQAILHFQDGSVYFYAWTRAYIAPDFSETRPDFGRMLRQFTLEAGPRSFRGHDDCPIQFLLQQGEPHRIEWVSDD